MTNKTNQLNLEPHHDGSALYVSTQTPALGDNVTLWVRVPAGLDVSQVHVRMTPDAEPRFTSLEIDDERSTHTVGGYGTNDVWWRCTVTVRNPVSRYRFMIGSDSASPSWLTARGLHRHDVSDATDFRLVVYDPPPEWMADSVVYEVFPDRFARSTAAGPLDPSSLPDWALRAEWDKDSVIGDGPSAPRQFFGGDLDGICEHLDHIQQLGANTIYLRPVFPAPSNHRYNASTFDVVDPLLGGEKALRRLADAVHARGMRIVGDITTNHCGDTHDWFLAAKADADAPEREMFYFHQDGSYEAWYGVRTLPKLNWNSSLLRQRMVATLQRWLDIFDGWRVDVANMTGRHGGDDHNHEVARLLRVAVTEKRSDALFLAEHNHDATPDMDRDGWQATMYYAGFTRPLWTWLRGETLDLRDFIGVPGNVPTRDGVAVLETIRSFASLMSWRSLTHSWQLLDSYDCARFRTVSGSRERHLVGVGLQMTMPGTPMISGGSEFGIGGRNGEHARVPMPWNRPDERDEHTHRAYRELIALRRSEPALTRGGLRWLFADADTLIFARETIEESLLVAARRGDGCPIQLPLGVPARGLLGAADLAPQDGVVTIPAGGPSVRIWRLSGEGEQ